MQPVPESLIPINDLWLAERRQRSDLDVSELVESIERLGQLQSLVVTEEAGPNGEHFKLLAGARRWTAMKQLGFLFVRVVHFESLEPHEQQMIELHENIMRKQISWQDQSLAIARYYLLRKSEVESVGEIADELKISRALLDRSLAVAPYIAPGAPSYDERIAGADTLFAAASVVHRRAKMKKSHAVAQILATTKEAVAAGEPPQSKGVSAAPESKSPEIICADFIEWSATYSGPKFDFIHFDPPYGIDYEGANSARVDGSHHEKYDDSKSTFDAIMTAFFSNWERFTAPQAHLLMWFDMRYREWIIDNIEGSTDFVLVTHNPITWGKSDNMGIASDIARRPRHTSEYAMIFSRNDRELKKLINDCVWAPTLRSNRDHRNEKPEPMLRQILPAFVNLHTRVLDPTCGSGTSLIVSDELGAEAVLGLEFNPKIAEVAQTRLASTRALRAASQ